MTPQFFKSTARTWLRKRAAIGFFRTQLGQQITAPVKEWAKETLLPENKPDEDEALMGDLATLALLSEGRQADSVGTTPPSPATAAAPAPAPVPESTPAAPVPVPSESQQKQ